MKLNPLISVIVSVFAGMSVCFGQVDRLSGRVSVEGSEIAYQTAGNPEGEAVVLIHGGMMADAYSRLLSEPALSNYYLVTYHRRGHGDSGEYVGITTLAQQTDDVIALMEHLGIGQAHLVGHSAGAPIALSVAASAPSSIRSVVSLEGSVSLEKGFVPPPDLLPDGMSLPSGAPAMPASVSEAQEVIDSRLQDVLKDPDWQVKLEQLFPGAVEQIMQDAMMVLAQDQPFTAEELEEGFYDRINVPVLYVLGENTTGLLAVMMQLSARMLSIFIPDTKVVTVAGIDHSMQIQYPNEVAQLLADWLSEHSMEQ